MSQEFGWRSGFDFHKPPTRTKKAAFADKIHSISFYDMASIYTKIQRKVNRDEFDFLLHALNELDDENFSLVEVEKVILKPFRFFEFTDDESHIRYAFDGEVENGRMLRSDSVLKSRESKNKDRL